MAIEAVIAGAALTYGVYTGEQQKAEAKKGLRRQQAAQQTAERAAMSQQRKADEQMRAANRQTPDVGSILAFENQFPGFSGPAAQKPVDTGLLKLDRPKLLGAP